MVKGVIPLVDFSVMSLNCQNPPSQNEESVRILAEKIHKAFSTIGFVYLTNHGLSDEEVCAFSELQSSRPNRHLARSYDARNT